MPHPWPGLSFRPTVLGGGFAASLAGAFFLSFARLCWEAAWPHPWPGLSFSRPTEPGDSLAASWAGAFSASFGVASMLLRCQLPLHWRLAPV